MVSHSHVVHSFIVHADLPAEYSIYMPSLMQHSFMAHYAKLNYLNACLQFICIQLLPEVWNPLTSQEAGFIDDLLGL